MRALRILFILLVPLILAAPSFAAEPQPFDATRFEAAQRAGQPILIDIRASWCPTCAAQQPILDRLTAEAAFRDLVVFTVDFDSQKDIVRRFGADMQSTLIAFRGTRETGRSVGETDAAAIEKLIRSAEK